MRSIAVAGLPFLLAACASADLPPGSGEGLVAYDRAAPAGTAVVQPPAWTVGDRFVYRRGGKLSVAFRVTGAGDDGYALVEEGTGLVLELTPGLAERARGVPNRPDQRTVRDPADHELHWPLWVGKRWTCQYLEKRPGEDPEPVRVHSRCEASERIRTATGAEYDCLRIARTARLELAGRTFLDRTVVLYYCPEVGWFVRRLEDGVLTELEQVHRQRP